MIQEEKLQKHLKHCSRSKEIPEVALSFHSLVYMDEPTFTQTDTCGSSFNAISRAHTKYVKGYAVTGVGGVDCARHGFKRPNGVVDLQKGER